MCDDSAAPIEDPDCDVTGWPRFELSGYYARRTCNTPLSYDQLRSQLTCDRPVAASWRYLDSSGEPVDKGRMMIVRGSEHQRRRDRHGCARGPARKLPAGLSPAP